jgi:ATP-dependent helicase/nuclease subunit A
MHLSQEEDPLIEQDTQARIDALDTSRSFLVQAPAGSGKTELLTQRLLALLSVVEKPEQVLAITFTVAATAEMRRRVIDALEHAEELLAKNERPEDKRHAIAALEHSRRQGWNLLEQPQRLNIQTIDSLCLRIAYEAPLLSRLGGQLQPTEDVKPLYALAARRTIERLGGANPELSRALEQLLRRRDVSLNDCEKLIAGMLGERDRWLEEFSSARSISENEWAELRKWREEPLRHERERILNQLKTHVERAPELFRQLLELAVYACNHEPTEAVESLAALALPDAWLELSHFSCARQVLLIGSGEWRKSINKSLGFPTKKDGGSDQRKQEMQLLIGAFSEVEGLQEILCEVDDLPNAAFTDSEWQTVRSVFTVLVHAAAELRVVFAERSIIDFVEAGITAEHALRNDDTRRRWSEKIHHLLVDEFQDTSRRQYSLLKDIVREWDMAENRTCFLVGDPMQSIYLFRNAELALFEEVRKNNFGPDVAGLNFTHLTLMRNFRSTAGIVGPINAMFLAEIHQHAPGASRFTSAVANPDSSADNAMHFHAKFCQNAAEELAAQRAHAQAAISIISGHMPALKEARAKGKDFRIGVLVRSRKHISFIAAALRAAGIPYRALDIETLNQRQEIRDLVSLMRALIHPMDRVAWLAVLRAPWCGLSLADLHILNGSDDKALQKKPVLELLEQRMSLLSEDGCVRARRVHRALSRALATRFEGTHAASPHGFAQWIEQTWTVLGGPHCVDAGQAANVQAFFRLLAKLTPGGLEASESSFDRRLDDLFAQPDPQAPESCSVQLMTIHKAKGLGFDVVLVPDLDKNTGKQDTPLLRWLVRTRPGSDQKELLIAPIGIKGQQPSATNIWLGKLRNAEEQAELHRLLYVACTRARKDLHLFATLKLTSSGADPAIAKLRDGALLRCGWSYLQQFAQQELHERLAEKAKSIAETQAGEAGIILDLAAGALEIVHKTDGPTQQINRLPSSWSAGILDQTVSVPGESTEPADTLRRRVGSLASRARGTVLHALFESLASLPSEDARRDIQKSLPHWKTAATAMLHHAGLHHRELDAELKAILAMLRAATSDPEGHWILGRRPFARSESSWTVTDDSAQKILRCDRVFLAGAEPLSEGEDHLWIVDYKTAEGDTTFLVDEQKRYEPQLQSYAAALREATASTLPVRLALYYPALPRLLWWAA